MQPFLIDLLIVIGIVWLTQVLLGAFEIKEPANKIIFVIVLLFLVLWLITGGVIPHIR
mgnify:CR=1 FL=1